jgi:hypothetical protein
MENGLVILIARLSATCAMNPNMPAFDGVPVMAPLLLRLSPPGRAPELIDQVYGGVPPDAPRVCEYAVPTVPEGSTDVVTVSAGELIVSEIGAVAEADVLSVTFTLTLAVPAVLGVPEIVPPAARVNPAGSDPLETDHV